MASAGIPKTKREQIKCTMCVMGKNCTYFDKDTSVRGELTTSDVIVEGSFQGKIAAKGNVLLKESVHIDAEIKTPKLMVEKGANYRGHIFLTNGDE